MILHLYSTSHYLSRHPEIWILAKYSPPPNHLQLIHHKTHNLAALVSRLTFSVYCSQRCWSDLLKYKCEQLLFRLKPFHIFITAKYLTMGDHYLSFVQLPLLYHHCHPTLVPNRYRYLPPSILFLMIHGVSGLHVFWSHYALPIEQSSYSPPHHHHQSGRYSLSKYAQCYQLYVCSSPFPKNRPHRLLWSLIIAPLIFYPFLSPDWNVKLLKFSSADLVFIMIRKSRGLKITY